jgi:hypothetical protein
VESVAVNLYAFPLRECLIIVEVLADLRRRAQNSTLGAARAASGASKYSRSSKFVLEGDEVSVSACFSRAAKPFAVFTRFGIRSVRRYS